MKKLIVIGLAIVCVVIAAVALGGAANVEVEDEVQVTEVPMLSGLIVEVADGYFVIADAVQGEVQVNFGEETVFEGVDAPALSVGQHVMVDYDGKMTRSLPPQVFGLRVAAYPIVGSVLEIGEERITIEQENGAGEAIIFLPEGAPELAVGDVITAYTTGAMTMSLPPQTTALAIEVTVAAE